jgi:hypothetical protein
MAFNGSIEVLPNTPVLAGDAAVANIRIDNPSSSSVALVATLTSTPPAVSSARSGITLHGRSILAADLGLVDLFPGIGEGPFYIWVISPVATTVSVSHA